MENVFLIVGLGNPGPQYARTRHNIGFMIVDALGRNGEIPLKEEKRMKAIMGIGHLGRKRVILAEPQTYMNLSGESVHAIHHYYKVPPENILIIFDDVALPFGKMRFRPKGSAGSHNGMKSVIQCMGTPEIARLRVGVDAPGNKQEMRNYVLGNFLPEQQAQIDKVINTTCDGIMTWLSTGVESAMNQFNGIDLFPPPPPPPAPEPPEPVPSPVPSEEDLEEETLEPS